MYLKYLLTAVSFSMLFSSPAFSAEPNAQVKGLIDEYRKSAGGKAFSAEEGRKLFTASRVNSKANEERSCTTCHTANPSQQGKTPIGKAVEPLAPAANAERFTDAKKVEKWFKRNCEWVYERECTPKEKGDFITYIFSVNK